jgi:hypothetical protein
VKENLLVDERRAWALKTFGEDGVRVRELVPTIIRSAHDRMADAQSAAEMANAGVYGQVWLKCLKEFESVLGRLPSARLVKIKRATYKLVSINDVILFPWRYARDGAVEIKSRQFAGSDARRGVFLMTSSRSDAQLPIPFEHPELTAEEARYVEEEQRALLTAMAQHQRVVVVGFASSPASLYDVQWGEAVLAEDGKLELLNPESLLKLAQPALADVNAQGDGFASGDRPAAVLGVRETVNG